MALEYFHHHHPHQHLSIIKKKECGGGYPFLKAQMQRKRAPHACSLQSGKCRMGTVVHPIHLAKIQVLYKERINVRGQHVDPTILGLSALLKIIPPDKVTVKRLRALFYHFLFTTEPFSLTVLGFPLYHLSRDTSLSL